MARRTIGCHESKPYERTKIGVCYRLYYDQCASSRKRNHPEPQYSKDDLAVWIQSQQHFDELYSNWVESNYMSDLKPSCDRLNNSLGYSFDNIELVTWKENKDRANADVIDNKLTTNQTKVWKYSLDGHLISSYDSIAEACRIDSKLDQRNITSCCQGKIPTSYGYFWSYSDIGSKIDAIDSNTNYLREIFQYDPYTGDIVNIYDSILDIPRDIFNHMKIRNVIQGVYTTHNGYVWSLDYLAPGDAQVDTTYLPKLVQQLSMDDEVIKTYSSMLEASRATSIGSGNISKCCNNKAKSAGGYQWRYALL